MPSISSPVSVELFPHDSVKENRFDLPITPDMQKLYKIRAKCILLVQVQATLNS